MFLGGKILNSVKNILKSKIPKKAWENWFNTFKIVKFNNEKITFSVDNPFIKDWIQSNFKEDIEFSIKKVTGKNIPFEIIFNTEIGEKNKNITKNSSSLLEKKPLILSNLNDEYTFDKFIIGPENRAIYEVSREICQKPGRYNPFFIYGGVGLGKTHLMHAIGHYILNQNPNSKILYVSSENFTNDLINSIKDDKNTEFRNKYRKLDVLLVDDIQFIAGKERTQEEFFHTFNALHQSSKQIIISSDRPPRDIKTLEDRLRSRFEWGLITDIQPPDFETRIAILKKKAEVDAIQIPNEVYDFIAERIKSNIRELEGALTRVVAFSSLTNRNISYELAEEALKELISSSGPVKVTSHLIQEIIANQYNISIEDLSSPKRMRSISFPRQIAMYLCRELTNLSLPKIGQEFGGRDHTTVMHAYDKIQNNINDDIEFKNTIQSLMKTVKGE